MPELESDPSRWSFMSTFRVPAPRGSDWQPVEALIASARAVALRHRAALPALVEAWDRALADVDGEPLRRDWRRFRPLRLSREEDWSDWLHQLLELSESGRFAAALFGRPAEHCARPSVAREQTVAHRRLDLLISWRDESYSHVEVKVGDLSLAKTFETAALNRAALAGKRCDDWLLLPRADLGAWTAVEANAADDTAIRAVTWHDVARALRVALRAGGERTTWRVWAVAFLGAVHQTLLGHPLVTEMDRPHLAVAVSEAIEIMEGAIDAE